MVSVPAPAAASDPGSDRPRDAGVHETNVNDSHGIGSALHGRSALPSVETIGSARGDIRSNEVWWNSATLLRDGRGRRWIKGDREVAG